MGIEYPSPFHTTKNESCSAYGKLKGDTQTFKYVKESNKLFFMFSGNGHKNYRIKSIQDRIILNSQNFPTITHANRLPRETAEFADRREKRKFSTGKEG